MGLSQAKIWTADPHAHLTVSPGTVSELEHSYPQNKVPLPSTPGDQG